MGALEVRTFVKLEPKELKFVRDLQKLMQKHSGRKRRPPISGVIQGILLDYKNILEMAAEPDFLAAYERVRSGRRKFRPDVE